MLLVSGHAGAVVGYMFTEKAGGNIYWLAGFAVSFAGLLAMIISRRSQRE